MDRNDRDGNRTGGDDDQRAAGARLRFAALAAALLCGSPAHAQPGVMTIAVEPPNPRGDQSISITLAAPGCPLLFFGDGFQQQGNDLIFKVDASLAPCVPNQPPQSRTFPVGFLPPGSYMVVVETSGLLPITSAAFRVSAAQVPALGNWGLIALCLALALAAAARLRRRSAPAG
jgi:hypothetical protein